MHSRNFVLILLLKKKKKKVGRKKGDTIFLQAKKYRLILISVLSRTEIWKEQYFLVQECTG